MRKVRVATIRRTRKRATEETLTEDEKLRQRLENEALHGSSAKRDKRADPLLNEGLL